MGREVKRVPLDFSWPLRKVWSGYLMPERLHLDPCPNCERGYSPRAEYLHNLWYGNVHHFVGGSDGLPFHPERYGSKLLTASTPAVRQFAEQNVRHSLEYYGTGEPAIVREATRLASLWNGMWCHHLNQDDVNALAAAGRLYDFTHTWVQGTGWVKKNPAVIPTAEQVNVWSLSGFGHDSINCMIAVRARCQREGVAETCAACDGAGSEERYPGQAAEAEAWEPSEPPAGDGWQLWETVSEGSPVSPVFSTAEELATWMSELPDDDLSYASYDAALAFIGNGWAPSLVVSAETAVVTGVQAAGIISSQ